VGRARQIGLNLAVAAVATAASLALVEAYLRWSEPLEVPVTPGCYAFSDNPRLMYEMKPLCGDTNALGMRDRAIDPAAPGDRIAALGDSITYGPGVTLDQAWPKRLEQMIARAGGQTAVLNFAVQGYSTMQEVETLRVKGLEFRPRVVLLQYFMNDEEVYTTIFQGMVEDLRRRQQDGYLDVLDPRRGWLARRILLSRTAIKIRAALARWRAAPADAEPGQAIKDYYTEHSPVREGLLTLKALAEANHMKVLVLVFPHAYGARADRAGGTPLPELTEYPKAWVFENGRILAFCEELGFTCIDVAGRLHANPKLRRLGGHRIFSDGCCHLTALGHKVMAWVVFRELASRGWLKPSTPAAASAG
jgi:GDSL-like Lipase/Acylhydrolase family